MSYNIPCAVTMKVRNSKASEKTTALMLKTIVGVLVYRIKTIIYILLIWNFHQHSDISSLISSDNRNPNSKHEKVLKPYMGLSKKLTIIYTCMSRMSLYLIIFDQTLIDFLNIISSIHLWRRMPLRLNFPKWNISFRKI